MSNFIIYHHNDLDGRCAAAIMSTCDVSILPGIGQETHGLIFREVDYKDEINLAEIKEGDVVAVVDFSFKPEVMAEVRKRAKEVIWCDHHITAKDYGYDDLPGYRDFSHKGLSGCECTWKFCHPDEDFPTAVELIGDYDSWRLEKQPSCFEFYEGMKIDYPAPGDMAWNQLLGFDGPTIEVALVDLIKKVGQAAIQYRDSYCKLISDDYGYETQIDGHKAYAMNLYRFGSASFGKRFNQYPVCLAYIHDGGKYTVSLYSETVDVSVIAKNHGGGGHKGAAGFVCTDLPFKKEAPDAD